MSSNNLLSCFFCCALASLLYDLKHLKLQDIDILEITRKEL